MTDFIEEWWEKQKKLREEVKNSGYTGFTNDDFSELLTVISPGDVFSKDRAKRQTIRHRHYSEIRLQTAEDFYFNSGRGIFILNKTTRVGCTTSTVVAAVNRGEKVLIIVPTNRIAKETIIRDVPLFCNVPKLKIVQLLPNSECVYNQYKIQKCKDLKLLQLLPKQDCRSCDVECPHEIEESPCTQCINDAIPDCESCKLEEVPELCKECEYKECTVYKRCHVSDVFKFPDADVYVATAQKMAILMQQYMTPSKIPFFRKPVEDIFEILYKCKVVIFDEVHLLHHMGLCEISLSSRWIGQDEDKWIFDLGKYSLVSSQPYIHIVEVVRAFRQIVEAEYVKECIKQAIDEAASKDYRRRHIRKTIKNNFTDVWGNYIGVFAGMERAEIFGLLMQEITAFVESGDYVKCRLNINDVNRIYDMAVIAISEKWSISAVRSAYDISANISALDINQRMAISSFCKRVNEPDKTVVLTSATIDETYKYLEEMKRANTTIKRVVFGEKGDPKRTNAKFKIFAASRKMSIYTGTNSLNTQSYGISQRIVPIRYLFGTSNTLIIAANKDLARTYNEELDIEVTYYKSDKTIGVRSDCRVGVGLGYAWKPSNSFDSMTEDRHESDIILEYSNEADSWQSISRVKDPEGIEPSAFVYFGVPERDALNAVSWGNNRKIIINKAEKPGETDEILIEHDGDISKPEVVVWQTYDQLIFELYLHLDQNLRYSMENIFRIYGIPQTPEQYKYNVYEMNSKVPIINSVIIGTFMPISYKLYLYSDIIRELFYGKKEESEIKEAIENGKYFTLNTTEKNGTANFVKFGSIEDAKAWKLSEYLYKHGVPHILEVEERGDKNIFVLIQQTIGSNAKDWAKNIKKQAGIKCVSTPNRVIHYRGKSEEVQIKATSRFYILGARGAKTLEAMRIDISKISSEEVPDYDLKEFWQEVVEIWEKYRPTEPEYSTEWTNVEEELPSWEECLAEIREYEDSRIERERLAIQEAIEADENQAWIDNYIDTYGVPESIVKAVEEARIAEAEEVFFENCMENIEMWEALKCAAEEADREAAAELLYKTENKKKRGFKTGKNQGLADSMQQLMSGESNEAPKKGKKTRKK